MADHNKDSMTDELETRLEDLFSEPEEVYGEEIADQGAAGVDSPLTGLKSILLSIDWEISDEILDELRDEIERLRPEYEDDKAILVFLQMLDSIGKYIKIHKANAHPEALRLLNEVFENLEAVTVNASDVSESEKKRRLFSLVGKFKKLKTDIKGQKAVAPAVPQTERERPAAGTEAPPTFSGRDFEDLEPHEMFALAVEEIKKMIAAEFSALRTELKLWRSGR